MIAYIVIILAIIILVILDRVSVGERRENFTNVNNFPKIIHMTLKDKDNMSDFYRKNYESWKRHHPDWDIRLYDDNDLFKFIDDNYPQYAKKINTFDKMIFKIDIFKLLVMHKYGGIYTDMDVKCLKSFNGLLKPIDESVVFGYGPNVANRGAFTDVKLVECAVMISRPKDPFWLKFFDSIDETKKAGPVEVTGPYAITRFIEKYENKQNIKLLDPIYFYPINNQIRSRIPMKEILKTRKMIRENRYPKKSYCVHFFGGSWWDNPRNLGRLLPGRKNMREKSKN